MLHPEMFQHRPYVGRDWMNNRNAKIALGIDDIGNPPSAGTQKVNPIDVAMRLESFFDVAVDLFARQLIPAVKVDRDPRHRRDIKPGLSEVSVELLVDRSLIRGQPEETPDPDCAQCFAMAHSGSNDRNSILLRPSC